MEELFSTDDLKAWYMVKEYRKKEQEPRNKNPSLYFCKNCKSVWELITEGPTLRYKHIPKYGLRHKVCCKKPRKSVYNV